MNNSKRRPGCPERLAQTAVIAGFTAILGAAIFGAGEARAEARTIKMDCAAQKEMTETIKPGEDTVILYVDNCICADSAEKLQNIVLSGSSEGASVGDQVEIKPGETITKTLYCYTHSQIGEFLPKTN